MEGPCLGRLSFMLPIVAFLSVCAGMEEFDLLSFGEAIDDSSFFSNASLAPAAEDACEIDLSLFLNDVTQT